MATTASVNRIIARENHTRGLLLPFSSWFSDRVSPVASIADCISPFTVSVAVEVLEVAVLSRFTASAFIRLTPWFAASCLSRMRLSNGGAPVVLSIG